jgi:hypothetical protein
LPAAIGTFETISMKSSTMWAALLLLILFALLGYGIVKAKRARETHRARSDERTAAMLLAMHQQTAQPRPDPAASARAAVPAPRPAAVPAKTTLQRKARLLDDNQRLLYLVLRSALSDHVIMTNIRIADLIDGETSPAYGERETKLRLLAQERLDCIVCSNDLVPLAAVMVYDASSGVPDERIKVDALRELNMRFLRFRADGLPKPAEMRGLVLG